MNLATNYQRFTANPVPFDAKRANWYVVSNKIVIESVAQYLIRISLNIRDGSPIAMYIPKDGYTSLGNYPIESLDATLINYDTYLYAFIEGVQDANFVPVFKMGEEYLLRQAIEDTKGLTGFVNPSDIGVSYNWTNRTITLTGVLDYYWRGDKHTLVSPWISSAHANTVGKWMLYSTDGETFAWSTTMWTFTDVMVSFVNRQATSTASFAICETHGTMDWLSHVENHQVNGTYLLSGGKATAGTYTLNTATDVANSPGFDLARLKDEDRETNIAAWTQGTYTKMYIGVSNTSIFNIASSFPFVSAGSYLQVNNALTGAMTDGINNRFYNVYQILVPCTSDADSQKFRTVFLQPQKAHTAQVDAEAETVNGLLFGELETLTPEFKVYSRITYTTSAGDLNTGKCRIASITYVLGTKGNPINVGGVVPTNHAALSNLPWVDSAHIGTANKIAGFGVSGEAVEITPRFTYTAYASDVIGTGFTLTNNTSLVYMAVLVSAVEIQTPVVGDFVGLWRSTPAQVNGLGMNATVIGDMGLPSTITSQTGNTLTANSHTHAVEDIDVSSVVSGSPIGLGVLYNKYVIDDARKITSSDEWTVSEKSILETTQTYLGGDLVAGGRLKEEGFLHWESPNLGATNDVGFNGLGSGQRWSSGEFYGINKYLNLWVNTLVDADEAFGFILDRNYADASFIWGEFFAVGSSIRLMRQATEAELLLPDGLISATYTGNNLVEYGCTKIGTQIWINANLNETKYRNGDWITGFDGGVYTPISNANWAAKTTEAMCYYNDVVDTGTGQTPLPAILSDLQSKSHVPVTISTASAARASIDANQVLTVNVEPTIIPFTASSTPTIPNYSIYAAIYGQTPTINLYENYTEDTVTYRRLRPEGANLTLTGGLITSVGFGTFDPLISGFIKISI